MVMAIDAAHARVGRAQRELLSLVADMDGTGAWREDGARDLAHWLSMRYGISAWKAQRWIGAAHALEELPALASALSSGELGADKVLELCRFAVPETEARLIRWAKEVSCATVRRRADREVRPTIEDDREADRARSLSWWWFEEGRRFGLSAELPAAQGAVVARALERMAERIPPMPGEEGPVYADARRADALVAVCSAGIASDPDPDRATVVVHTSIERLMTDSMSSELEDGTPLHPETVRRLICDSRTQIVVEGPPGNVVGLGRISREPSASLLRQVRYRDRGCRFPGCGTKAFTHAHHIRWWRHGGRTELENLLLICSFHHKLVHEYGWSVKRDRQGGISWFRPDGTRYRAGPAPPAEPTRRTCSSRCPADLWGVGSAEVRPGAVDRRIAVLGRSRGGRPATSPHPAG